MAKLTKNNTLEGILANPRAKEILAKYKVPCLTCPMVKFEMESLTLGQICQMYNLDLEALLKELNKKAK